jgi:hypothetical protein
MDFSGLTALEHMSLSDRERVHTALLSWLLGQDSPVAPAVRGRIAAALASRRPGETTSTTAATEVKNLDVLVDLDGPDGAWALAVEAKLKSKEHSNQLARYDEALTARPRPTARIFLTLAGDPPSTPGWLAVSYERLASVLRSEVPADCASPYARDYLAMVERLAAAAKIVETDEPASVVFDERQVDPSEHRGFVAFVARLRLRKILQQLWMTRLCARTLTDVPLHDEWHAEVDETHGAALLNFQNSHLHPGYCVGLQVQYRVLKMFCYPVADRPSQEAIVAAAQILTGMAATAAVTTPRTRPRNQGFTSVVLGTGPEGRDVAQWARAVATCLKTTMDAADERRLQGRVQGPAATSPTDANS